MEVERYETHFDKLDEADTMVKVARSKKKTREGGREAREGGRGGREGGREGGRVPGLSASMTPNPIWLPWALILSSASRAACLVVGKKGEKEKRKSVRRREKVGECLCGEGQRRKGQRLTFFGPPRRLFGGGNVRGKGEKEKRKSVR